MLPNFIRCVCSVIPLIPFLCLVSCVLRLALVGHVTKQSSPSTENTTVTDGGASAGHVASSGSPADLGPGLPPKSGTARGHSSGAERDMRSSSSRQGSPKTTTASSTMRPATLIDSSGMVAATPISMDEETVPEELDSIGAGGFLDGEEQDLNLHPLSPWSYIHPRGPKVSPRYPLEVQPLAQWLLQQGAELNACVQVVRCANGQRCVLAGCKISAGETVFSIPNHVQLRSDMKDPICPGLADWVEKPEAREAQGEWQVDKHTIDLATRLLLEVFRGFKSPYVAFINTVPKQFDKVLYEDDAMRTCLNGTPGQIQVDRRLRRLSLERRMLVRCIEGSTGEGSQFAKNIVSDPTFLTWARSVVGSRSYQVRVGSVRDVQDPNDAQLGLIPLVDLLNDDLTPNANWERFPTHVQVTATQDLNPGEEVRVSYGKKSSLDLLLQYGFVHRWSPRDVVHVDLVDSTDKLVDPPSPDQRYPRPRLALTYDSKKIAKSLPYSIRDLEQHLLRRKDAKLLPTGSALEELYLKRIFLRCKATAEDWGGGEDLLQRFASTHSPCGPYRANLVDMVHSCMNFAVVAIEECRTGTQAPNTKMPALALSMLARWREVRTCIPDIPMQ